MVTAPSLLSVQIFQAVTTVHAYLDTLEMDLTVQVCCHHCEKLANEKTRFGKARFDMSK